jgi:hypothetical protein
MNAPVKLLIFFLSFFVVFGCASSSDSGTDEDIGDVPANAAVAIVFTDTDADAAEIAGDAAITMAADESDVTHYVLYWGSDADTRQNETAISEIEKTGTDLTYTFSADTVVGSFPGNSTADSSADAITYDETTDATTDTVTHLLVFTKNENGEMATGISIAIIPPENAAAGISFTDTDTNSGEIAGGAVITMADDESDITYYMLYWGSDADTKKSAIPLAAIAKTGSDLTYTFSDDTTTDGATHLLVFTRREASEMATGTSVAITDVIMPANAASGITQTDNDLDSGEISGTASITKASDETDITHYALYWGSDATTKTGSAAITTLAKTGNNLTYTFSDTATDGASHLLVYTRNAENEMSTGVATVIEDIKLLGGTVQGRALNLTTVVTTVAGSGGGNNDGYGTASATFNHPTGITTDGTYYYVADEVNRALRKIDPDDSWHVTTLSTDGVGTTNMLPKSVTTDGNYIYTVDDNRILRFSMDGATSELLAGPVCDNCGSFASGDVDDMSSDARFFNPRDVVKVGNYLYVTDYSNQKIRRVDYDTGETTTFAGGGSDCGNCPGDYCCDDTGTNARFYYPIGITSDGTNLYVTEEGNCNIRKIVISTQAVTTLAGTGDSSSSGNLGVPTKITTDGEYVYFTSNASDYFIGVRRIKISDGTMIDIAGGDTTGNTDATGAAALFNNPQGIVTDGSRLYITDEDNHRIRQIE